MLRVFAIPFSVPTARGRVLARFAVEPTQVGEPWWVIYRSESGRWFTAMLPDLEPTG
jgi:hypothetical protein